jgi:hypothetical protein
MKKQKALKVVNPFLSIAFATVALTGVLHALIPWEVYHVLHPIAGYAAAALVATHIALNWSWISMNYLRRRARS